MKFIIIVLFLFSLIASGLPIHKKAFASSLVLFGTFFNFRSAFTNGISITRQNVAGTLLCLTLIFSLLFLNSVTVMQYVILPKSNFYWVTLIVFSPLCYLGFRHFLIQETEKKTLEKGIIATLLLGAAFTLISQRSHQYNVFLGLIEIPESTISFPASIFFLYFFYRKNWTYAAICGVVCFIFYKRSAIMSAMVCSLFYYLTQHRSKRISITVTLTLIGAALSIFFLVFQVKYLNALEQALGNHLLSGRAINFQNIKETLLFFTHSTNWLTGFGFGSCSLGIYLTNQIEGNTTSQIVDFTYSLGLFGIISLVLLVGLLFKFLKNINSEPENFFFLSLLLMHFMMSSLTEDTLLFPQFTIPYLLCLDLTFTSHKNSSVTIARLPLWDKEITKGFLYLFLVGGFIIGLKTFLPTLNKPDKLYSLYQLSIPYDEWKVEEEYRFSRTKKNPFFFKTIYEAFLTKTLGKNSIINLGLAPSTIFSTEAMILLESKQVKVLEGRIDDLKKVHPLQRDMLLRRIRFDDDRILPKQHIYFRDFFTQLYWPFQLLGLALAAYFFGLLRRSLQLLKQAISHS